MQSFVYDLKNDTANLNEGFPRKEGRLKAIDSMFLYFQTSPNTDIVPGSVLRFMRRAEWGRHYRRNSTTIEVENIEDQSIEERPLSTEDEKIPETSTLNVKPSTSNMEVHKHPHHIAHKKMERILRIVFTNLLLFLL